MSNQIIGWFKSYLSNQLFRVNVENCYSDPSNITCRVRKGSILEPLNFLMYVNDMSQAVKSNLFLNSDTLALHFRESSNEDFTNICGWFVNL